MEIDVRDMPYAVDVTKVQVLSGHRLKVRFDDNNEGIYDMTPLLGLGVFKRLQDDTLFSMADIEYGTVVWPGNLDIAAERLWTDCEPLGDDWRPRLLPKKYFE